MSKRKKIILSFCLLMSAANYVVAQQETPNRPVVNDDIIQMSRAGVLPAVAIAKIKSSQCRFDTSPSALVSLKQLGVADEVLMEMVRNPNGGTEPTSEPRSKQQLSDKASPREAADSARVNPDKRPMVVKRDPSTFRNKSRFSTQYDKFKDETHVRKHHQVKKHHAAKKHRSIRKHHRGKGNLTTSTPRLNDVRGCS